MAEANIRDSTARLRAIARRLQELTGRLEEEHDSRCVFAYAYAIMTWKIANDLPDRPDVDVEWVTSLAEAFRNATSRRLTSTTVERSTRTRGAPSSTPFATGGHPSLRTWFSRSPGISCTTSLSHSST